MYLEKVGKWTYLGCKNSSLNIKSSPYPKHLKAFQVVSNLPFWTKKVCNPNQPSSLIPIASPPRSSCLITCKPSPFVHSSTTCLTPSNSLVCNGASNTRVWKSFNSSEESKPSLSVSIRRKIRERAETQEGLREWERVSYKGAVGWRTAFWAKKKTSEMFRGRRAEHSTQVYYRERERERLWVWSRRGGGERGRACRTSTSLYSCIIGTISVRGHAFRTISASTAVSRRGGSTHHPPMPDSWLLHLSNQSCFQSKWRVRLLPNSWL